MFRDATRRRNGHKQRFDWDVCRHVCESIVLWLGCLYSEGISPTYADTRLDKFWKL